MPFLAAALPALAGGAAGAVGSSLIGSALAPTPQAPPPVLLGAGLPGGSPDTSFFNFTDALKGLQAPQQDPFRQKQDALSEILMAAAQGQGPSVAVDAANTQRQRSLASALALMSSVPGRSNVGLAQQMAARAGAAGSAEATRAAGEGRLKELFEARNSLGGLLAQGRQGDVQSFAANQQAIQAILQMALERELNAAKLQQGGQDTAYRGAQEAASQIRGQVGRAFSDVAGNAARSTLPGSPPPPPAATPAPGIPLSQKIGAVPILPAFGR
jgi:hypothetical protein